MTHDVFISYSNKDKPIADGICANLETAGIRCWIAPRDIAPGEDWPAAISHAVSKSRVMVLVFSSNSNKSEDVSRELFLAANYKVIIIPFKIENVEPEAGKQYYLGRTHWLDAINPPTQEQIHALIDYVKAFLAARGDAPTETQQVDQPIPGNKPPFTPLPVLAPRKKVAWMRYLWLPALLVFLGLIGWAVITSVMRPPLIPLITRTAVVATVPATATHPIPATSVPTSTVFVPAPLDWNVSVSDIFSSNVNGWPTLNNSNDGCSVSSMNIQSGVLLWTLDAIDNNGCGYVYYPRTPLVSDFDTSMDVTRSSGTGDSDYGIGFRIINADNYYIFVVNDMAQNFTVRRILNNAWSTLIDWKYNTAINSNGSNHLTVSGRAQIFNFYINDKQVGTINDSGIASGHIGIISEIFNGGNISISFDNFVLHGIQ
jgi:hypothetical protein